MKNQFQRLFLTLNAAEIRRFVDYLSSPYLNHRPELLDTFRLETEGYWSDAKPSDQLKKDYAKKPEVQQRLLRSDLLAQLEAFLGSEAGGRTADFRAHLALKNRLKNLEQDLRYRTHDRKSDTLLAAFKDGPRKSRLAYELRAEQLNKKLDERQLPWPEVNQLQKLHERNFLLESFRLGCDGLSVKGMERQKVHQGLLPMLLTYSRNKPEVLADQLVQVYAHCYATLLDATDDASFYQLQALLGDLEAVDPAEARDLILLAINACIRRINSNRPDGERFAFQLYSLGLENGYLLDQGRISRFTFNNIVALALKTGDKQRAEDFVNRYAKLLPQEYAQSTEALNRARLAFEYGRLEEAMEYLQSAKDQEVLTTLNIRILQMRVYYELTEFRLLDAHLDALDIYLRRRKDQLGYRYKIYRNLVGYVRRFRRLNPFDKEALAKFRREVEGEEQLPERGWLLRVSE